MFTKTVIISLIGIICLSIGGYDSVFIKVGRYDSDPSWAEARLNWDNCGRNHKPFLHNINRKTGCFVKQYPNETREFVYQFPPFETMATNPSGRIMGARESLVEDSPWTVKLIISYDTLNANRVTIQCTGVLITFDWVLTAATCLPQNDGNIKSIEVRARNTGSYVANQFAPDKYKIFHHKSYKHTEPDSIDSRRHNIGLLKLALKLDLEVQVDLFYIVNTVCLSEWVDPQVLNEGVEKAILSGWGHINTNEETNKVRLKQVTLRPAKECVRNEMLCGPPGEGVSCTYDMGGPLIQYSTGEDIRRAVLVGILHNNTPAVDCNGKQTDVYVPLTSRSNQEWIKKTIEDN